MKSETMETDVSTINVAGSVVLWHDDRSWGMVQSEDARVDGLIFVMRRHFGQHVRPAKGLQVRVDAYKGPRGWRATKAKVTDAYVATE